MVHRLFKGLCMARPKKVLSPYYDALARVESTAKLVAECADSDPSVLDAASVLHRAALIHLRDYLVTLTSGDSDASIFSL